MSGAGHPRPAVAPAHGRPGEASVAREEGAAASPLRLLTFTTLYPNDVAPHHGVFVEQRLRKLLASGRVTSRVIAPVPWFPSRNRVFGAWAAFAGVARHEVRHGIAVAHPRYPLIPKIGMSVAPLLLATAVYPLVKRYAADEQGFDVIDAHYFYPDGVAAALLGKWLAKPVTITARGTDVNLIPQYALPRKWIRWAASRCAGMIAVSEALRKSLIDLEIDASRIRTLRNGVDLDLFRPVADREALRRKLGLDGPAILSVGHLIERKGHHLVIEALASLPGVRLVVAGDGPMREQLRELARRHGVESRVTFAGAVPHEALIEYYNAADALVLASSREGMANVLLESIACGTPVVATPYWGNPEVVADARAGVLTEDRTPAALAAAVRRLLEAPPERAAVRQYAETFSWDATTRGQIEVLGAAARRGVRSTAV